jgi:orotidine-5'-phosphate decarboxylase
MTPELIVALDVDSLDKALALRDELGEVVDFFKVGKELFTAEGPHAIDALSGARVFLDLKFHDIPNTVAGAVASAAGKGVDIIDVHVSGGRAMMEAAAAAGRKAPSRPKIFGVTVLTHLTDDDLRELGFVDTSRDQVVRLAKLAHACGLDGVVASPLEVDAVRRATDRGLEVLVPGVRPKWAAASHDQKRVATPGDVARAGARYVVVGRPITQHERPKDAAKRILDELVGAA